MIDELDEWELTNVAGTMLHEAGTASEKRAAMIAWLRGARLQVSPSEDDTDVPDAIIAALEALDLGKTFAVLTPAPRVSSNKSEGAITAAKARAVAAVDLAVIDSKYPLEKALQVVCEINGMDTVSLSNIRKKIDYLNPAIKELVGPQLEAWRHLRGQLASVGLADKFPDIVGIELEKDRSIFELD